MRFRVLASAAAIAAGLPALAAAEEHLYSYDAASPATRTLAPTGLSFQFEKKPFGASKVRRVIQTGERGSADLGGASESELGQGGLRAALGGEKPAGRLYEIEGTADGPAFVRAICPGAERAWLVVGELERFKDLTVQAVGRDADAPASRHCVTLTLRYKSEWTLPPRNPPRPGRPRMRPG